VPCLALLSSEIDRRLNAFRLAGIQNGNVTGQNAQVMWDQALVNDVYHQWISGNTTYFRSCWLGFGAKKQTTTCFSECCDSPHPFGLRPGAKEDNDTMAWHINKTFRPLIQSFKYTYRADNGEEIHQGASSFITRPEILVENLGSCGTHGVPIEHENQCHTRGMGKVDWLKEKQCWDPRLDVLLFALE